MLEVDAKGEMLLEGSKDADREVICCIVDEDGCLKSLEVASSNSSRLTLGIVSIDTFAWGCCKGGRRGNLPFPAPQRARR